MKRNNQLHLWFSKLIYTGLITRDTNREIIFKNVVLVWLWGHKITRRRVLHPPTRDYRIASFKCILPLRRMVFVNLCILSYTYRYCSGLLLIHLKINIIFQKRMTTAFSLCKLFPKSSVFILYIIYYIFFINLSRL